MNAPQDVPEFLEWVWLNACRYPGKFPHRADELAREAVEALANDCTDEYWELVERVNYQAPEGVDKENDPAPAMDWIEETLGWRDDILGARKKRAQKICDNFAYYQAARDAANTPAVILADGTPLEFDL